MSEVMEKLDQFVQASMDAMYKKGKADTIKAVLEIIDNEALMLELGGYGKVYTEPLKERIKALVEVTE